MRCADIWNVKNARCELPSCFQMAFEISATHQLQIWDALILAVAAESRCRLLLSEDFHDRFSWNGVTVVNPFAQAPSPLLERLTL